MKSGLYTALVQLTRAAALQERGSLRVKGALHQLCRSADPIRATVILPTPLWQIIHNHGGCIYAPSLEGMTARDAPPPPAKALISRARFLIQFPTASISSM